MSRTPDEILAGLGGPGARRELEAFFNHGDYRELERQLSASNPRFRDLSPKSKLTALYLNSKGLDLELRDFSALLYKFRPPTIEEYFTEEHGGPTAPGIYEAWRRVLMRDFDSGRQSPNELVMTGAIGTGKSVVSTWLHVWNLLRVCALRNPQATLDKIPSTLLVLALFTVTLDKASLALIKPFISMLNESPYFQAVPRPSEFGDYADSPVVPFVVRAKYVEFPNNIIINIGSKVTHAISYSMFAATLDEAEFASGDLEQAFLLYGSLKERVRSRFLGSRYTLLTLVSSSRFSQGIIADYIKSVPPDDPLTKVYSFAIWDVKKFKAYEDLGTFPVLRGTTAHPHKVLNAEEAAAWRAGTFVVPEHCEVITPPEVYRSDFTDRISDALQNLAGVAVQYNATFPFNTGPVPVDRLQPELKLTVDLGQSGSVFRMLPAGLFVEVFGERRFAVAPNASRYLHFDLALVTEAGFCCCHPQQDASGRVMYVVDFLGKIVSNTRIDLTAVRQMVTDLANVCHIRSVTTDQFQSEMFRQELLTGRVADRVEVLSTVKSLEPYTTVARLNQGRQILVGRAPELALQMTHVQLHPDRKSNKVSGSGGYRYDVVDGLVGSVYSCALDMDKSVTYRVEDFLRPQPTATQVAAARLEGFQRF